MMVEKAVKRAVIGAVLLATGVAYTGASWYMGTKTKEHVQAQIPVILEEIKKYGLPVSLRLEGYERGIFHSTAKMYLDLDPTLAGIPGMDEPPLFSLVSRLEIEHGPLPWGQLTSGSLRPVLSRFHYYLEKDSEHRGVYDFFTEPNPLSVHLSVGFDGKARGTVHLSPGELTNDFGTVKFSGAEGPLEVQYGDDGIARQTWLDLKAAQFSFGEPGSPSGQSIVASDLEYVVDVKSETAGLPVGGYHLGVGSVAFAALGKNWRIQDLGFGMDSRSDAGLFSAELGYKLGKLRADDLDFGGGTIASFGVGHIDAAALSDLYASLNEIAVQAYPSEEAVMRVLTEKGNAVLRDGLYATAGHQWKTAEGESKAQLKAVFENLNELIRHPDQRRSRAEQLRRFLRTMDGEIRLSVPMMRALSQNALTVMGMPEQEARAQADEMVREVVARLEKQYYLMQKGDEMVLQLNYSEGKFFFNDQALAPEVFLQLLGYDDYGYGDDDGDDEE